MTLVSDQRDEHTKGRRGNTNMHHVKLWSSHSTQEAIGSLEAITIMFIHHAANSFPKVNQNWCTDHSAKSRRDTDLQMPTLMP